MDSPAAGQAFAAREDIHEVPTVACGVTQGTKLLRQGEPSESFVRVTRGLAGVSHLLPDGRCLLLGFCLEGDHIGFSSLPETRRDYGLVALTPLRYERGHNAALRTAIECRPELAKRVAAEVAARKDDLVRSFVAMVGRSAEERVCYLMLSLALRQLRHCPEAGERLSTSLTQQQIGDATSLSGVHVNRVLQSLRRRKVVELRAGLLTIHAPEALARTAQLEPADYLESVVRFAGRA